MGLRMKDTTETETTTTKDSFLPGLPRRPRTLYPDMEIVRLGDSPTSRGWITHLFGHNMGAKRDLSCLMLPLAEVPVLLTGGAGGPVTGACMILSGFCGYACENNVVRPRVGVSVWRTTQADPKADDVWDPSWTYAQFAMRASQVQ